MTCTSRCAVPNSHVRAGCQCLRCRIRICVQAANVFAAEFLDNPCSHQPIPLTSFPVWPGHSSIQSMFVNNLRCRFPFDKPSAAQICAVDLSHCWHGCQYPKALFWTACRSVHLVHIQHYYTRCL
jgi:hypothetical protein